MCSYNHALQNVLSICINISLVLEVTSMNNTTLVMFMGVQLKEVGV
jgi:hypothetical protein